VSSGRMTDEIVTENHSEAIFCGLIEVLCRYFCGGTEGSNQESSS
jgi:hypothetical protein